MSAAVKPAKQGVVLSSLNTARRLTLLAECSIEI
jgi:hypothetical protein